MRLIGPVDYLDSIVLVRNARKVVTDSDGLQREAYFAGVPCITLDEATAWVETVKDGWNTLVSSDPERRSSRRSGTSNRRAVGGTCLETEWLPTG